MLFVNTVIKEYDRYINDMKISDILYGLANAITDMLNLVLSTEEIYSKITKDLSELRYIVTKGIVNVILENTEVGNLIDDYYFFKDVIEAESNPILAAERIKKSLTTDYFGKTRKATISFLAGVSFAIARRDFKNILDSAKVYSAEVLNHNIKNFYNKIRWIALVSGHSYRVAIRFNKYLGYY